MNFQLTQSSILISHSLAGRAAAVAAEVARTALDAFRASWNYRAARRNHARAIELMAGIDEHTLRDIGAPNWLVAQAVERKDAHRLRLIELHRS